MDATLFDRAFKTALRRSLARRPGDAAELLALWLEQSQDGIDELEDLLCKCHTSRRLILPPFSLETFRRELETNPLFEIDLEAEAERFQRRSRARGSNMRAPSRRSLDAVDDLIGFDPLARAGLWARCWTTSFKRPLASSVNAFAIAIWVNDARRRSPRRFVRLRPRSRLAQGRDRSDQLADRPRGSGASQGRDRPVRLRRPDHGRCPCTRRPARRGAGPGDASPLSLCLDRRVPGYRRASVVVLPHGCSSRAAAGTSPT